MSSHETDTRPSLEDAAAANAQVEKTEQEIRLAQRRIFELGERVSPLHVQAAEVTAHPRAVIEPDQAHVDALLANPSAKLNMDAIVETIARSRQDDDVRLQTLAVINAAIGKIEGDIAEIETEIVTLKERREAEWIAFVKIARNYLSDTFKARFIELRDTVMLPLDALTQLRIGGKDVSSLDAWRIARGTEVIIDQWIDKRFVDERLYPLRDHEDDRKEYLAGFRAALRKSHKARADGAGA